MTDYANLSDAPAFLRRRTACAGLLLVPLLLILSACENLGFKPRVLKPGEKHPWEIDRHPDR